jgi:hypothetical protein
MQRREIADKTMSRVECLKKSLVQQLNVKASGFVGAPHVILTYPTRPDRKNIDSPGSSRPENNGQNEC